jgi:dTDP-4-dehydrorhamnose reductase
MPNLKIVVTGANSQLGKELKLYSASFPRYDYIFLSKEELSVQHAEEINRFFESERPDFCINCAAYTAVDKAETEKDIAFAINGKSPGLLATACRLYQTKLIHLSTDYVFDGWSSKPLKEDAPTDPVNIYGASKLMGEQQALQNNPQTLVIRTAWLYSEFGNNFVKTMIRLMGEKDSIKVIDDQVGSPTYAADLAKAILQIIDSEKFNPGIYHYSNEGRISWFDFAMAIKEFIHSDCHIHPIPSTQYRSPARRPAFSLLDKTKIRTVYGVEIPEWKTSLNSCIVRINKKEV